MKRISVILALIFLTQIVTVSASAQSSIVIDQMMIEIWPEYDREDVLVIYRISLDGSITLPAQISLLIPREAGEPYNIAMQDVDGLLYSLPYTTELQSNALKVVFTTPSAGLQIEYYDPRLNRDGDSRQFLFSWVADYDINNLSIAVQQPLTASNMQILPSFGSGETKADGLIYYTANIGKVNAGQKIDIEFNYTKPDDQLSIGLQQVQPSQPLSDSTPGKTNPSDLLPYILGGIGAALLVGAFAWFWLTKIKGGSAVAPRRRHRAPAGHRVEEPGDSISAVYCHQCGRRAAAGDIFCRICGTRLRGE